MKTTIKQINGNKITFVEEGSEIQQEFELEAWVKPSFVKLGEAEVTISNGKVSFVNMKTSESKPNTKTETKWEDDVVSFETLLTKAHALKKPFSIKTEMIQIDLEKKYALFHAQVEVTNGDVITIFEGHGDATIENVTGEFIKPHFIRMAETRAICRALRWYTNNACAEEEK